MSPRARRVLLGSCFFALGIACGGGKGDGGGSSTTGEPEPTPCDAETPCPGDEVCVVGECYGGDLPTLEIVSPEDEALVDWNNEDDSTDVTVRIQGTGLELATAEMDPSTHRGVGQIAVFVDGTETAVVDEGDLAEGVEVTVPVPTDAGGHRIRAIARLTDGQDYDTEGAVANRFFWFDDGRVRVGFKAPWDGDVFTDEAVEIQVIMAALNFDLAPAEATSQPGDIGHTHLFLNESFPDCASDPACDHVKDVAPVNNVVTSVATPLMLPATTVETVDLTALLVKTNHDPYCGEGPDECTAVYETITIQRATPGGADTGGSTGGGSTSTGGGSSTTTGETADCGGFVMTAEDSTTGS
jgi:hypothetical protein